MNREIPLLIDPALGVDAAALQKAWNSGAQARELGRLEERAGGHFMPGVAELIVAVLAGIGVELLADGIKQMIEEQQRKAGRPQELFVAVTPLPGGDTIVVQPKPVNEEA